MSKVKNENYIVIQGFMIKELKLKGNELIIYSIIYGFSQTENQRFTGGLQYLADWTNSTKQGVIKNLKSLVDKGYIMKEDKIINGVKFCEYYSTELNEVLNKVEQGIKQSLTPIKQSLTEGSKQSLTNNINNNINNNITNNKENISNKVASVPLKEEEILKNEFEELWELYPKKRGKKEAFDSYCKYRKSLKDDYVTKEDVRAGIDKYNNYIKVNYVQDRFIKYGSTFFEERAWEDDYSMPVKSEIAEIYDYDWLNDEAHYELA